MQYKKDSQNMIKNIAISGITTRKQYKEVCKILGAWNPQTCIYKNWKNDNGVVYYDTVNISTGYVDWSEQNYKHCKLFTYNEFIKEFANE